MIVFAAGNICQAKQNINSLYGEWRVYEINGAPNSNKKLMMGFNIKEHRIFGNAGCNTFFALIRNANGKKISFGQIGATRMSCPEGDNYEFTKSVSEVASYKINKAGNLVELKNKKGNTILKLVR